MPFDFESTPIPGVTLVTAARFADNRGHFLETFREAAFSDLGLDVRFVQINESVSKRKTLRGLHYQLEPHAQGKLVRVLRGAVLDVAVDIRKGSPTFGKHVAAQLDATGGRMMWIPPGFAHGFCALADDTHFLYMQTHEYVPTAEAGIDPLDPELALEWPFAAEELLLSPKDLELGPLALAQRNFVFAE
ncbi:MAG: dTDP-4-dehydrorhamnose 3,5-epimerase [Acidobacteria bacterium]|nr:dTDP-4-dehydrorhamnose 3,5-epimerase [Acidobacteriota bacterium]